MSDTTDRLGLPMIRAGQAQKELSHNDALAGIDLLLHPCAIAAGLNVPPTVPEIGQTWIAGEAPIGAWAGRADHLAGWTVGGWRFAAPIEGLTVWVVEAYVFARYSYGYWQLGELTCNLLRLDGRRVLGPRGPAVTDVMGGTVIDVQARATLTDLLERLREHGLIDR